jgi:hypothetical protein
VLGNVVRTKKTLHIIDLAVEELYSKLALIAVAGARSMLAAPKIKENELAQQTASDVGFTSNNDQKSGRHSTRAGFSIIPIMTIIGGYSNVDFAT